MPQVSYLFPCLRTKRAKALFLTLFFLWVFSIQITVLSMIKFGSYSLAPPPPPIQGITFLGILGSVRLQPKISHNRYVSLTLFMRVVRSTKNPRSRSAERFSSQPGLVDAPDRTNPHMESHSHSSQGEQVETLNQVGGERLCRARPAATGTDQRGSSMKTKGQKGGSQPR